MTLEERKAALIARIRSIDDEAQLAVLEQLVHVPSRPAPPQDPVARARQNAELLDAIKGVSCYAPGYKFDREDANAR